MKTQILFLLIITLSFQGYSQTTISGVVNDVHGNPLAGVNVYVEGSYDGGSSGEKGDFSFSTSETGGKKLMASFIGYKTWEKAIQLPSHDTIYITLKESVNTLDAVTITAGSFAAADRKRAAILKPLDIYTTASANGDVMGAMRTMPGTQAATDDGRLMVRGGDAYESKTFIDGLSAAKPYYSKTPDVPTRGRFSPSLFSGVMFNSGGYSAEYGQALSSVLILNSNDIATSDVTGASLMTIGAEASTARAFPNSSFSLSGGYTNMALVHALLKSNLDWTKPVESVNASGTFKYKPSARGMIKAFVNTDWGWLAYKAPDASGQTASLTNKDGSVYSNITYNDCLSDKSCFRLGSATTYETQQTIYNQYHINNNEISSELKFAMVTNVSDAIKLTYGASDVYLNYQQQIEIDTIADTYQLSVINHTAAVFAEGEIKFSKSFAIRPGCRAEYSSLLMRANIAPRMALALSTGKKSQLSAAWGVYYQNPETDYLKFNSNLNFEKAIHYIISFQTGEISDRLFRTELYYKNYNKLITWEGNNEYQPMNISNGGSGYATGADIFWRDKKTIKNLDYWVTYSFVDTKRLYKNYPTKVTPDFISKHNASIVAKYWVNPITTQFGASFTTASSRPYDDPSTPGFMDKHTRWYTDLSLNISKIFFLGDQYSVLYFSVSNVLGSDNVFGYKPSTHTDAQGNYELVPVKQDMKRFVFLGLFLNF